MFVNHRRGSSVQNGHAAISVVVYTCFHLVKQTCKMSVRVCGCMTWCSLFFDATGRLLTLDLLPSKSSTGFLFFVCFDFGS